MKHFPSALAHLDDELAELRVRDLFRERPEPLAHGALSFCSNDYLGLAALPGVPGVPAGCGASRLVAGERHEHRVLERAIAAWLQVDAALVFSSGFAANLGVLSSLVRAGDLLVSDALNHASLIDGARLSRAEVVVIPHLDVGAVDAALASRGGRRAWVATESYFSMDADIPDVRALRACCDARGAALIVDEAHALGIFGPDGRGVCAERGVVPDVLIGTLGKSFGAGGAFVAGSHSLVAWLWNRARPFVFSTGLSPALAAAALRSLRLSIDDPTLRARVAARAAQLRDGLMTLGISPLGTGPIIPWVLGEPAAALAMAMALRARDVHVQAIRPPTVPVHTARIRFTVTAAHDEGDVERALVVVAAARTRS